MKTCTVCGAEWPDETKFCPNDGSTLRTVGAAASLVGSVIAGRYHIEKKLGEGGMGAVYLGEHVKMGRKSAIKVMAQSMSQDPEAIARFNREAANAARINHSNVCAIYDFGETEEGLIYLAMEFIEGESLSDLLRREGALPLARAVEILRQTADALQAAHDLGIVHRDLKPDNIMLARTRGGADVVKVVDFGIAKAMGGEEGQKVTKTGLVVGTPEYMSPEQLSGDVLDGRSDVYSLALVFFRMLTGRLPFDADSAQEMMIKRLTDEPLSLAHAAPAAGFPPRLQQVLNHALQKMPGERYGSAARFATEAVEATRGAAAAAPAVDTEGATQLLDGSVTAGLARTRESAPARAPTQRGAAREPTTPVTPAPRTVPISVQRTRRAPVVAIAASVVVLAAAGAGAVLFTGGGGGNGAPPDTMARVTGPETGGVTQPGGTRVPAGGDGTQRGRDTQPAGGAAGGETRPPPTFDSAAAAAQLADLFDGIDAEGSRPAAMRTLQELYDNTAAPANLRAEAASYIGYGHFFSDNARQACLWLGRAIQLLPSSEAYRRLQSTWRCS